jgi:hypothetical protein
MVDERQHKRPAATDFACHPRVNPDEIFGGGVPTRRLVPTEPEPEEELVEAEVAVGRSVHIPNPAKRRIAGFNVEEKRNWEVIACDIYEARAKVRLPISEIKRLRASGHLIDPDRTLPASVWDPQMEQQWADVIGAVPQRK